MAVLKLLLVRHGESQGNREGRMEGCSSTALTEVGEQQAYRLGQWLANQHWQPTHIYCSPLIRATATLAAMEAGFHQTADPLASREARGDFSALTMLRADLKENHLGIFNGLTWAQACDRYPELCQKLESTLDWHPIPQAETLGEGHQRAQGFVEHIMGHHGNGDRLWVISHQWILQQIIARLLGSDRAWGIPMPPTALFEFWLDHRRWPNPDPNQRLNTELWKIRQFNDRPHLEVLLESPSELPGQLATGLGSN